MKLTKRSIDAIKPDKADFVYWDAELRGFGLRVSSSGHIGQPPEEARREARRLLSEVERGFDPAEQLLQERNAITVADLCRDYLSKAEAGLIFGRKGSPKKPAPSKSISSYHSRSPAKSQSRTLPAPT
jgi:hypothetical protein